MNKGFQVKAMEAGERVDKWLCKKLGVSRGKVKKLLDNGQVFVNSKQVYIAGWELVSDDKVEIVDAKSPAKFGGGFGYVKVFFEDDDIIVVDKPAGILSVPNKEGARRSIFENTRSYLMRKHPGSRGTFLYPVHRLDTETSGVMVFARSSRAKRLEDTFREHHIEKIYYAIVNGRIEREAGRVDLPIEKGRFGGGRKSRVSREGLGKNSITDFRVKERYKNATLLELNVRTGRTHQIRVHMAEIGHPIIGDKLYGKGVRFKRQALHAHMLGFNHPANNLFMKFHSPMPADLEELIENLRKDGRG